MSSSLGLPSQFEPYQIAITTISSIYLALFVMVSNHYVFKPKVQHLFIHSIITSKSFYQFLIDFLTNLTQLTFAACSLFLINRDDSLSVMIYSDMSWCGILLAIVAFKNVQAKNEPNSRLLMVKNIIFMLLVYATIAFHYALGICYISLGIALLLLYFANLIINEFEYKFIGSMQMLFGYKSDKQVQQDFKATSLPITPEYLSKRFPVTSNQLANKLRSHERQLRNIKLQTRRSMVQNLLKISLAINISKQKLYLKAKKDVKCYYGVFNGTVTQKSRKLILQKQLTKQQTSQPQAAQFSYTVQQQSDNSAIFYIFPVKIFEHSKILSIMFSIVINFGLGVLLSLSVNIASTLNKGYFLQIIYGLLLLPLTPNIGKQQFLNSMTLSSLWKYCLYGIFLTFYCLNQNSDLSFHFQTNHQLIFSPIFQFIALVSSTFFTLSRGSSSYSFFFVWFFSIGASCIMIFKYC